jgi:hypothetical protein
MTRGARFGWRYPSDTAPNTPVVVCIDRPWGKFGMQECGAVEQLNERVVVCVDRIR